MVAPDLQAKAETVIQQVQAVEDCRREVKKSTSKIDYSSRDLVLPMLVEVAIANVGAQDDNAHGRTLADELSSSFSSSSSLTHDKSLNDGPMALSAAHSEANDYNCDDNCFRSEQGEKTLESTNRELKQHNETLQKTVKECYQALTHIQHNADLKQQKLELEITFLRRALADATTINQRLKICVETRELQQIATKSGDSDPTQRLMHRDRAVERHLTSMLTSRNQAVKENYQLRKMVLKSCYSCRSKLSTAIKQAKSAVAETLSTAAVANLPLDMSEHSHSTGSRMNELIKEVPSLEERNSSFASPRPSLMRKKHCALTTPLPGSPRRGILRNSIGVLPPPAEHCTGNYVGPNKVATAVSASSTPQQSPRQASKPTLPRTPLIPTGFLPPPAVHLTGNYVKPNKVATTVSASSTLQQSLRQAPKPTLPRIPLIPATPKQDNTPTSQKKSSMPTTARKTSSSVQQMPRPQMIAQTSTSSIVDSVPSDTGNRKERSSGKNSTTSPSSECSMTLVSDVSSDLDDNRLSSSSLHSTGKGRKVGWRSKVTGAFRGRQRKGDAMIEI
jgi:hypothetical protein